MRFPLENHKKRAKNDIFSARKSLFCAPESSVSNLFALNAYQNFSRYFFISASTSALSSPTNERSVAIVAESFSDVETSMPSAENAAFTPLAKPFGTVFETTQIVILSPSFG